MCSTYSACIWLSDGTNARPVALPRSGRGVLLASAVVSLEAIKVVDQFGVA